jgi:hypothetical protein
MIDHETQSQRSALRNQLADESEANNESEAYKA